VCGYKPTRPRADCAQRKRCAGVHDLGKLPAAITPEQEDGFAAMWLALNNARKVNADDLGKKFCW
jgi:hypothetical protein